jgi:hypothetical protein
LLHPFLISSHPSNQRLHSIIIANIRSAAALNHTHTSLFFTHFTFFHVFLKNKLAFLG